MSIRTRTYGKTFDDSGALLDQHRFRGRALLPAAAQVEMMMFAVLQGEDFAPSELRDLAFPRPLALGRGERERVGMEARYHDDGRVDLALRAEGRRVLSTAWGRRSDAPPPAPWAEPETTRFDPDELYSAWAASGLEYGPDLRVVRSLSAAGGHVTAELDGTDTAGPWLLHPHVVDGVLQLASVAVQDPGTASDTRVTVPVGVDRLAVYAPVPPRVGVRVRRVRASDDRLVADAQILAPDGSVVAVVEGVRMHRAASPGRPVPGGRIHWAPAEPGASQPIDGTWVVLRPPTDRPSPLAEEAARVLRERGAQVVEVVPPAAGASGGLADRDFEKLWERVGEVSGVVHLRSTGAARDDEDEFGAGVYTCLHAVRTLASHRRDARFVVVTENAQPVVEADRPVPARSALWGLVRTAAIEYPGLAVRLVDAGPGGRTRRVMADALGSGPLESAHRDGVRYEPSLVAALSPGRGADIRPDGRYLILGGHGGIGVAVAERLARDGAGELVLVGRSGPSPEVAERLSGLDCRVRSLRADASVPGELASVVSELLTDGRGLAGVVHAAGILRDGLIRGADVEDLTAVMRPKVAGTRELAAAVSGLDLDFAVLFGSVSGTFGNLGQAGYAAANAYLDGFAHTMGRPWTTVSWGLWGEVGMGVEVADQLRRRGVRPLGTEEALDALMAVLGGGDRRVVVAHPDGRGVPHPVAPPPAAQSPATPPPAARPTPPAGSEGGPESAPVGLAERVQRFLAARLGLDALSPNTPLADYGVDSIMSVEMSEELSRIVGADLPATLFLEYPDAAGVTRALTEQYGVPASAPAEAAESPSEEAVHRPGAADAPTEERLPDPDGPDAVDASDGEPGASARPGDIAVVAVSGDLPGGRGLEGFWELLESGDTAFTEVPAERWDLGLLTEPGAPDGEEAPAEHCRSGAFLRLGGDFDHRFFGTSRREADEMDPQQKLLLEHAWRAVDEAGLHGRSDIGVFVGATYEHHRDASGLERVGPHTALGSMNAVLANRISYTLDLTGPSQTVDTLCSSSLVALHQAVHALRSGQCGAAIVATCHVGLTPWYYRSLTRMGALSPGRPHPFDERADGFVPGEGAVAMVLRPLADAERDGDHVWGVVRGSAVNHGGRGGALPVPRASAQEAVIRAALADADTPPEEVTLIEAHGTATRLGDPIEVAALTEVFGTGTGPRLLGSVKANIGHLEPASGMAGLVKVLLCMRYGVVPPLAGYERPSTRLDLDAAGLSVNTGTVPWPGARPRVAGVSAFGMGGTNAHVVVAEHVARPDRSPRPDAEHVLVLSGHTPEALAERVSDAVRWLPESDADLADVCFSAAVGRDHREFRAAFHGGDRERVLAGMRRVLREGRVAGRSVRGDGSPASGPVADLAARFVEGADADWRQVYPRGRRVVLPAYPLGGYTASSPGADRETAGAPSARIADERPARVPLPDGRDTELLVEQHRVFGEPTVPAALLLLRALDRVGDACDVVFAAPGTGPGPLTDELSAGTLTLSWGGRRIARARAGAGRPAEPAPDVPDELDRTLDPVGLYAWFAAHGVEYGADLAVIEGVRYDVTTAECSVRRPSGRSDGAAAVAAVDAALQAMAVLTMADRSADGGTLLPASVSGLDLSGDPSRTASVLVRLVAREADGTRVADSALLDDEGRPLLVLTGVRYRPVSRPGGEEPESPAEYASRPAGLDPLPAPAPAPDASPAAGVTGVVGALLREPDLTPDTPFTLLSLDSMLATEIAQRLEAELGVRVGSLDVMEAADCRALASAIGAPVAVAGDPVRDPGAALPETVAEAPAPVPSEHVAEPAPTPFERVAPRVDGARPEDVAVVGLSVAVPGAHTPDAFWRLLAEGGNAVAPAPDDRWEGTAPRPEGGFLSGIDSFDARLFGVFAKQAKVLDPQSRWLMRGAWECLESAGTAPTSVAGSRTGVFVGASYQHYREYNVEPELDALSGLGNHNAFLANRVSHFLDLRGPSMTIDTLCSSSLVALHQAVRSIRGGECDQAVVAGVRLALSPLHYHAMRSLKALSPSGRSRAFDAAADGFVPGEGVVTLLVKPLGRALRDGDRVHAVIRGTAVNHGGRSSGLTVPNAEGQREVVSAALRDAGVDAGTVTMVEAHGTGTPLGDPIEVEALTEAFRAHTDRRQFCAIGSVKSNIGHLEPAAGLAGLAKVVLAMRHRVIPATLHVERPNPHIDFASSPFFAVGESVAWEPPAGVPRRAGLSAFGMGGVNAHVVVEEPPVLPDRTSDLPSEYPLRVSGATEEAVRSLAAGYAERIAACRDPRELADVCHTVNTGRAELGFQAAVLGSDADSLVRALRVVADGAAPVSEAVGPFDGVPPSGPAAAVELVRRGHTGIPWADLSAPEARVADGLPPYPFAERSFWSTRGAGPAETRPWERDGADDIAPTAPPRATRPRWRAATLPEPARGAGGTAAVVCEGSEHVAGALGTELSAVGFTVAPSPGEPGLDALIVVDPGPEGFWPALREWTSALPRGGRLVWVGRRTAAVTAEERLGLAPDAAARAAATLAAAAEYHLSATALDLAPGTDAGAEARAIVAELSAMPDQRTAVALRGGLRYVRRWEETDGAEHSPDLSGAGFVLVTGGSGAVGRLLVGRLAELGAARVGVLGRSRLDAAAVSELAALAPSAELDYLPCDVTDGSAVRAAVRDLSRRWGPLIGVVHASGRALPFGSHRNRAEEDAAGVLAPKTAGSDHVLAVADEHGARFVVFVSSVAGEDPAAGRGLVDYAMANAYQLALAERAHARSSSPAVTAHAWPDWSGVGLEADASFSATASLGTEEALAGFSAHLLSGGRVSFPGGVPEAPAGPETESHADTGPHPLSQSEPPVRPDAGAAEETVSLVRSCLTELLGEDPGTRVVADLGLDSLAIADLVSLLERHHGSTVDPSAVMRARTVADIAVLLEAEAGADPAPEGEPAAERDGMEPVGLSALLRPLAGK
ncbi:SDR family NAD(P)-dependent oxidoreductase [Nocardiopsis sp. YSL2]|uniref:SDR family NAD(P)-dependent oxidoreductase n=1 Tax=Nocardiopsis sp. YSL2 TaxID=2939492 RepID=UPI0026F4272E|nr:SDR family NAD(P)-dependent oxidoreductase [Nocardiopsis sp. YSL2]